MFLSLLRLISNNNNDNKERFDESTENKWEFYLCKKNARRESMIRNKRKQPIYRLLGLVGNNLLLGNREHFDTEKKVSNIVKVHMPIAIERIDRTSKFCDLPKKGSLSFSLLLLYFTHSYTLIFKTSYRFKFRNRKKLKKNSIISKKNRH